MAGGAGWQAGRVSNKCLGGDLPHQICLGIIHQATGAAYLQAIINHLTCKSKLSAADDLECLDSKIKPLSVTAPVFIPSGGSTTLCGGGGTTDLQRRGVAQQACNAHLH